MESSKIIWTELVVGFTQAQRHVTMQLEVWEMLHALNLSSKTIEDSLQFLNRRLQVKKGRTEKRPGRKLDQKGNLSAYGAVIHAITLGWTWACAQRAWSRGLHRAGLPCQSLWALGYHSGERSDDDFGIWLISDCLGQVREGEHQHRSWQEKSRKHRKERIPCKMERWTLDLIVGSQHRQRRCDKTWSKKLWVKKENGDHEMQELGMRNGVEQQHQSH